MKIFTTIRRKLNFVIHLEVLFMDLIAQVEELKQVILDVKDAVFAETMEIAEKIQALEDKLKEYEGLDLSVEIEDLKASVESIRKISDGDEDDSEEVLDVQ